jgi:SecD/SecF fusion protein
MHTARWKVVTYSLIVLIGIVTALPNILTPAQRDLLPHWWSASQITLGLDLRGGAHLVLEVDTAEVVKERMQQVAAAARTLLADAKIRVASARAQDGSALVRLREAADQQAATAALRDLSQPVGADAFGAGSASLDIVAEGDDQVRLTLTEEGVAELVGRATQMSLEVVRLRIDEVGVLDPTVQRVGADRILVQLPGEQDSSRIRALLQSTAKMSFHAMPGAGAAERTIDLPDVDGTQVYRVAEEPTLGGEHLADAGTGFDPDTGAPVVTFRFDTEGARIFGRYTSAHVHEPFAIVLDGKVLSAPVIQEPILGGSGQISGSFTVEGASDLAASLRAGALPAPLTVIEERTVGADLGADAVAMGAWTGIAGLILVLGFMVLRYGTWGLIANAALLANIVLVFGALSWLGATLTLPGIAGIVLGIGMAVDANVLINERIREETRRGLSAIAALDAGFKRAYSTIVDANITTLIATTLLFTFGSGPVRGFAITMGLSLLISLFTAVAVARVLMAWTVRRRRMKTLAIGTKFALVPDGTAIRFMKARFAGIAVSVLLSAASLGLFIAPGLNYGIDFKGGIQIEVTTPVATDLAEMRTRLGALGLGEIALQEFGDATRLLIRAEAQPGGEAAQSAAVDAIKAALQEVVPGAQVERSETVGPKVSGELAQAGIVAVALAALAMLGYIWFRFEWPFAVGAIATLVLDVTKTVGFFALTGLDFNLTAIAALLTLIGYSVNDKVVVYDRMRENMRLYRKTPLRDIIDRSINETLGRSIYTSATTFVAIAPMALVGGSAVASFAWPMLFGLVIATSSSIFIAAPILLFLGDWRGRRRKARDDAPAAAQPSAG